jgi:hypothetical protein
MSDIRHKTFRDLRSTLAKSRDCWMLSPEGMRAAEGTASGIFLCNRLETAFIAGWNAREKEPPKKRRRNDAE